MNVPFRFQGQVHDSYYPRNGQQGLSGTAHSGIGTGEDLSFGGGEITGCCEERGIRQLSASAAHTALAENEDYQRLAHRFGTDGHVIRNGLAVFPTCTAVEYGQKVLLFDKTEIGDKELAKLLDGITEKFFEGKGKPKELGFYEITPLNAKYRSTMGDWQVASPEILNYGICTKRLDMAPTLRNFNRLRNLLLVKVPLTKEQERIMSQLVARPDNTRFSGPNMSVKVPMKRERRGMKI